MLQELRAIFGSNIKAMEILYVLGGIKPCARIMVKEEEKGKVLDFLKEKGLNYSVSDFKVIKQDEEKAYSDKAVKVPIDSNEKGHFFVYVSKDEKKAEIAKQMESENKHKELGMVLGYPECCAEFFEKHFPEESKRNNDFTLASLKGSDGFQFPFYTNIASRHFDVNLLSHFPCNLRCESSIEIAKKNLEIIRKHDGEAAMILEGMLKGAVIYTETKGVFLLRYPELEHNRLFYKGVMGSMNNELYEMLKNAEHIDIVGKNRLILNGLEMKNLGLMLFS